MRNIAHFFIRVAFVAWLFFLHSRRVLKGIVLFLGLLGLLGLVLVQIFHYFLPLAAFPPLGWPAAVCVLAGFWYLAWCLQNDKNLFDFGQKL